MKNILGHNSYTEEEIIEILKRGSYCCPALPHYRYERVQRVCRNLRKHGLIQKSGRTNEGINFVPSARFRQWQDEKEKGLTTLGLIKWAKKNFPPQPVKKTCRNCGCDFITINRKQKQCSKDCRKDQPNDER